MLSAMLVIFLYVMSLSEERGPHHPRGSKVVKYHSHYRPKREAEVKLTQDEELLHDTEHLQEHLENEINEPNLSQMSEEELEFYYFQVHDTDKNSKLDGLEILQAIYHTSHDDDNNADQNDDNNQFNYYN
ncbi:multiple coagulation factor deficiency protein 2 homolog [Agrilus planipennis]|uniref:Multiple coagulation factor deficiency protein 2 homolog n=1 Tax=Agrilus planipennis TaxID=224129 RepID=A0A7F5RGX9_AGRPL|nr:multiple coagulation factor deficiency protein 2 homolog [Agrilus planipennis]